MLKNSGPVILGLANPFHVLRNDKETKSDIFGRSPIYAKYYML